MDKHFQLDVEKVITKECNSTCPRLEGTSGEYAFGIACEFDLEHASKAMIDKILDKGLMLIAGECLRGITPGEKTYDKDASEFLGVDEGAVKESKKMVVDLAKYSMWKTSRRKKGRTTTEKNAQVVQKEMARRGITAEEYWTEIKELMESMLTQS